MAERGIDIADEAPHMIDDALARTADVIVTMGCGDACPFYPGKRYVDWDLADPQGMAIDEVRKIRDDIEVRVRKLIEDLLADR
jgi:arsenate reductase